MEPVMKAIRLRAPASYDNLRLEDLPAPQPGLG